MVCASPGRGAFASLRAIMGDKSPKATQKAATQKNKKTAANVKKPAVSSKPADKKK